MRPFPGRRSVRWFGLPDSAQLRATTALYFLLVCAIGILRPVTNSLALDGLAAQRFYRVYLVSAVVVLVVPLYLRIADRVGWRRFVPGCALFFAANLLLFRLAYRPGSALFALVFYGWYDLFAAVMVSQFFVAAQQLFDVRAARRAFPVVLAGGSVGATTGGLVTALLAPRVGTPNLLFPAAALVATFALALRAFWPAPGGATAGSAAPPLPPPRPAPAPLRTIVRDRDVLFIAGLVLMGVVVKQLVDFEFNVFTKQAYATRDAVSAFQGWFNAAIQWLPLLLLVLVRPLLRRRGVGAVVLLFPLCMLGATLALALVAGLAAAAIAKAMDIGFRNSAERTGREMLYLPLPERLRLRAKSYVDVAVETGLGKLVAALVISVALMVMDYRRLGWLAAALALGWLGMAVAARRHYVDALARSLRARATSFAGIFAAMLDANALTELRRALARGDPLQASFAADLLEQAEAGDVRPCAPELNALLHAPEPELRLRALRALCRCPEEADLAALRACASDAEPAVAEAAVRLLCRADPRGRDLLPDLLASGDARTRRAVLAALAGMPCEQAVRMATAHVHARADLAGDRDARLEVALALAAMPGDPGAGLALAGLLADPDAEVRRSALRSAAHFADPALDARVIEALGDPATRAAARTALTARGEAVREPLIHVLLDPRAERRLRRQVPGILARTPTPATLTALLAALEARATDRLLDYRILIALNRVRARHPEVVFDAEAVGRMVESEIEGSHAVSAALGALAPHAGRSPTLDLLLRSLHEALADHRERLFRALGLLHPAAEMHRCYLVITGEDPAPRAHALEWLEATVGARLYARLPLVAAPPVPAADGDAGAALARLRIGEDTWLAELATRAAGELLGGARSAGARSSSTSLQLVTGGTGAGLALLSSDRVAMELIEKVFLLQQVDLLRGATTQQLALLASIAEEMATDPGDMLLRRGEPTDAMHVVVEGSVELCGAGEQLAVARHGTAFGTWALIDEAPALVDARVAEAGRLLRITRGDFDDLLADHPELSLGLLRGLARRVRALAEP